MQRCYFFGYAASNTPEWHQLVQIDHRPVGPLTPAFDIAVAFSNEVETAWDGLQHLGSLQ